MKINNILFGLISGAVICFLMMIYLNRGEVGFTDQGFYDKLKAQNDSLRKVNSGLDEKIEKLNAITDTLEKKIDQGKVKIVYLKQKQNEKNVIISVYNGNQLYNFFGSILIPQDSSSR